MSEDTIYFKKGKDEYFRKSVVLATSNIVLRENAKASGSVERLSATILKAVQDQLFSMTRQKDIENKSKKMANEFKESYKESYIAKFIERNGKRKSKTDILIVEEEAVSSYMRLKKRIDVLAEKEAWRLTIQSEVKEDEAKFRFNAKSITEYANVNNAKKNRLYDDVRKLQDRFNEWTEKRFDIESGQIVDKDIKGVLFPYSEYTHGPNAVIELKLEKELLHCVLFLSNSFLKFHLDNYLKLENPNATRLYELLINHIHATAMYGDKHMVIDELQTKFGTEYASAPKFITNVIVPSVSKINEELGTKISWDPVKEWKRIIGIKFLISAADKKILAGEEEDEVDESITYTFEYYLMLLELGGIKANGDIPEILADVRARASSGGFEYLGQSRDELYLDYKKNLEDIKRIQELFKKFTNLQNNFVYDRKYLTVLSRETKEFIGVTATDSLDWLVNSFLVPLGLVSGNEVFMQLNLFNRISPYFPFALLLTSENKIFVNSDNFEIYSTSIMAAVENSDASAFEFLDTTKRESFYAEFNLTPIVNTLPVLAPEIIENSVIADEAFLLSSESVSSQEDEDQDETATIDYLTELIIRSFGRINHRIIDNKYTQWRDATKSIYREFGFNDTERSFSYLTSGVKEVKFFLIQISSPEKLSEYFPKLDHARRVGEL